MLNNNFSLDGPVILTHWLTDWLIGWLNNNPRQQRQSAANCREMPYYALYIPAKGAGIVSSGGHSTITAPSSPLNNNSSHLTSTESHRK